jgi:hypothetical protein
MISVFTVYALRADSFVPVSFTPCPQLIPVPAFRFLPFDFAQGIPSAVEG